MYREAVAAGTTAASRRGVKPFIGFYRGTNIKAESVARLTAQFGLLPSLAPVQAYIGRGLRAVKIVAVEPDGEAPVYDITVEDVQSAADLLSDVYVLFHWPPEAFLPHEHTDHGQTCAARESSIIGHGDSPPL